MTMKKILDILDKIEVAVASLVLLVLICVTFFGVLMRYISDPYIYPDLLDRTRKHHLLGAEIIKTDRKHAGFMTALISIWSRI